MIGEVVEWLDPMADVDSLTKAVREFAMSPSRTTAAVYLMSVSTDDDVVEAISQVIAWMQTRPIAVVTDPESGVEVYDIDLPRVEHGANEGPGNGIGVEVPDQPGPDPEHRTDNRPASRRLFRFWPF